MIDINKNVKNYTSENAVRKEAKSGALSMFFEFPFTFLSVSALVMLFAAAFCSLFMFFNFIFSFLGYETAYLLSLLLCFAVVPLLRGTFVFIKQFILTKKRFFYIIFKYYKIKYLKSNFGYLVYTAAIALISFLPFFIVCELPYIFGLSEENTLVVELISIFVLAICLAAFLSVIFLKKVKYEYISFFSSFFIHYIILYFTKGISAIYFIPYFIMSIYNYNKIKKR